MPPGLSASLTEELVAILQRPVGDEARVRASQHVADWLGTVVAGLHTEEGRILVSTWRDLSSAGPCFVPALGRRDAMTSAAVYGGLGITLELDDLHLGALVHPGDVVIPAALTAAQMQNGRGHAFLDAVVRGYEAVIRVGASVGPGHYRHWHNTASCGAFGAAAAVSSILDLDPGQWASALGNAGTQVGGLWQCREEKSMSKVLHTARAASGGLLAALLAQRSFTGPRFILEGPMGFYAATCPDPDVRALTSDAAGPWKIFEASVKRWPACGHVIPCIDAAMEIAASVTADMIRDVSVKTYTDALVFADQPNPKTDLEYKFSLQHGAAIGLLGGRSASAFGCSGGEQGQIPMLRSKVRVEATESPGGVPPTQPWGAMVVVGTSKGDSLRAFCGDPKGTPANPLTGEELRSKFVGLTTPLAEDASAAARLYDGVLSLSQDRPVGDSLTLLEELIGQRSEWVRK